MGAGTVAAVVVPGDAAVVAVAAACVVVVVSDAAAVAVLAPGGVVVAAVVAVDFDDELHAEMSSPTAINPTVTRRALKNVVRILLPHDV